MRDVSTDHEWLVCGAREAAQRLLGSRIVSEVGGIMAGGRIVETEAYLGRPDPASHAAERIGRTRRNDPMFGPAGTTYVYRIYGLHWCFNVVAAEVDDPQAVLIRAIEPEFGRVEMGQRRGRDRDLTNGPARLCQALGLDGTLNGHRLTEPPLRLERGPRPGEEVGVSGRIGIRRARRWPLRFFLVGHPDVSPARGPDPASEAVLP